MKKLIILIVIIIPLIFLVSNEAHAVGGVSPRSGAVTVGVPDKFANPLGAQTTSVPILIGKVIKAVLGVVGSIALIMFVFGGLTWMTAMGNQERVKKGGDILMWATIGLVVIFSAYAMVQFVIGGIT